MEITMDSLALSKSSITAFSYLRSEMSLTIADKKASEEYAGAMMRDIAVCYATIIITGWRQL